MTDASTLCRSTSRKTITTAFHLKGLARSSRERTHAKKELKRMTNTDMLSSRNHVVMIHRELLHPHPDNPRKDLGDLEELRNSINEHGIMQNLTIVPDGQGYKILIGHRRFAASEGILEDLPCVIAEGLSNREQVGIMLVENMQRSDLTYIEQAHGFQMMLDLGDTIEDISEKTGFSKATVKHRLAINEIDPEALKEAQNSFQPTIADFIALEKIKDIDKRNEILRDALNSQEIQENVEDYLEELERESNAKKYRELFLSLGWTESKERYFDTWGPDAKYKNVEELPRIDPKDPFDGEAIKIAAAKITAPVFFDCNNWSITFAIKNPKITKEKKKTKEELLAEKRAACEKFLNEKRIEMCDLYFEQITKISEKTIADLKAEDYKDITSKLCQMLINLGATMESPDKYYNIKSHCDYSSIKEEFPKYDILKQLMFIVWEHLSSSYENKLVLWNFTKNMEALKAHREFYKILNKFGFRLEKGHYLLAVINGTSEFYNAEVK